MVRNLVISIIVFTFSVNGFSEDIKEGEKPNYILGFVLAESLIGVNAWMASESPKVYGGVAALVFPLGGSGQIDEFTYWSGLAAAESLAVYNLTLEEDDYSKSEIFKKNVIAWHLFMGVVVASGLVENAWFNNETVSFIPDNGGGHIALNYKF